MSVWDKWLGDYSVLHYYQASKKHQEIQNYGYVISDDWLHIWERKLNESRF
jgi:hypothetical protein